MADTDTRQFVRLMVTFELEPRRDVAHIEKELWRMGGTEVEVEDEWEA